MVSPNSTLIAPYGSRLVDLTVPGEVAERLKTYASHLPSIQIQPRSVCDLELLATGAYSPVDRFLGCKDYLRVLEEMRLASGQIFPIPVTLPVEASQDLHLDRDIALRNNENELLGVLTIEEIYPWNRSEFAEKVFGTRDSRNPMISGLHRWGTLNISGHIQILHLPDHYDFQDLQLKPSQTRARLARMGSPNVVAYQPSIDLLRVDERLLDRVLEDIDATILLQMAVGHARLGDVDHYTRVRIYRALAEHCANPDRVLLLLTPHVRWAVGLRETLMQSLICRNYGANQVIVPYDQANHNDFQNEQELLAKYSQELGVALIPEQKHIKTASDELEGASGISGSNAKVYTGIPKKDKNRLGESLQQEITAILAESYPPRHQQGVCIWLTGLSGAGKSTTAEILAWLLMENGRRVTVLDGDVVRTHLSKGLGFGKEDRDTNVRRIGFVASELVRIGGVVVCSVVSPYRAARNDVREMMGAGHFVEVYVNTPLDVCESRDVKGMYARARRGDMTGFTGIDDPYEPPEHPEITLDTVNHTPQENARNIISYLIEQGFIRTRKSYEHSR